MVLLRLILLLILRKQNAIQANRYLTKHFHFLLLPHPVYLVVVLLLLLRPPCLFATVPLVLLRYHIHHRLSKIHQTFCLSSHCLHLTHYYFQKILPFHNYHLQQLCRLHLRFLYQNAHQLSQNLKCSIELKISCVKITI